LRKVFDAHEVADELTGVAKAKGATSRN